MCLKISVINKLLSANSEVVDMAEKELVDTFQWAVIYDAEKIAHQYDEEGEIEHNFEFVKELNEENRLNLLVLLRKDNSLEGETVSNPVVVLHIDGGKFTVNGADFDLTPPALEESICEMEEEKALYIKKMIEEAEERAYKEAFDISLDWEDRERATKFAKEARKLSPQRYFEIYEEVNSLEKFAYPKITPNFFRTVGHELSTDEQGKISEVVSSEITHYKIGWDTEYRGQKHSVYLIYDVRKESIIIRENR
jgi:hypothetical protein